MLTNFASTLTLISLTPWNSLTRQEMLDLVPLTNNPQHDHHDADSFLRNIPAGSQLRNWLSQTISGQFIGDVRTAQVARLVDNNSTIYAWGAAWNEYEGSVIKDVGIYVRPDKRRQGLGTRILDELRKASPTGESLQINDVHVHPWNEAGRKFFSKALR